MKNKLIALATFLPFVAGAATVVLGDENYDGTNTTSNGLVATQNLTLTTTGTGPAGSTGNVGEADLSTGGQWGEARGSQTQNITLPAGTVAGTDTFTMTIDYFLPSTGSNMAADDRLTLIARWNIGNAGATSFGQNGNQLVLDAWTTMTVTGTIPALGSDGLTTTTITPIVSLRDLNDDAAAGTTMFFDNWNLEVTTTIPEPSGMLTLLLGVGMLGIRRKR